MDANPAQQAKGTVLRRQLQQLENIQAYLTKADLAVLRDPVSPVCQKIDVACGRLVWLACHLPTEGTYKVLIQCCLLNSGMAEERAEAKHRLVETAKRCLKGKVRCAARSGIHLTVYPPLPTDLPAELLGAAYDASDPPSMESFSPADLGTDVPLRRTHRSLPGAGDMNQGPLQMQAVASMMQQMMMGYMHMGVPAGDEGLPNLRLFKPQSRGPGLQRGSTFAPPALGPMPAAAPADPQVAGQSALPAPPPPAGPAAPPAAMPALVAPAPAAALAGAAPADVSAPPAPGKLAGLPEATPPPAEPSAQDFAAVVSGALADRQAAKKPGMNKETKKASPKANAKSTASPKATPKAKAKAKASPKATPKAKAKAKTSPKSTAKSSLKVKRQVKAHRPLVDFTVKGKRLLVAFRLSRFPHGCGKCRGRPGCTRSCWGSRSF